jgi:GNAT superfamily N-acetyltransferase
VHIRPAIETDVSQLSLLIQALTDNTPHHGLSRTTGALLRLQAFQRTPPALFLIVAEDDAGALAGFGGYWITGDARSSRTMRVMTMFVAPHARRRRIGEALAGALAARALHLECDTMAWRLADATGDGRFFSAYLGAGLNPNADDYVIGAEQMWRLAGLSLRSDIIVPPTQSVAATGHQRRPSGQTGVPSLRRG